ncbi:ABC transporter ATP-binding protein [Ferrovibrio sp.]|uniref:ABC transporter ATP-binding protein n=1 Tax=Ferrovibrio sp. TaxID=1917215 RepID=UPI0025C44DB4|nr:ABC transporter ATP-binding protein [Ferrovibrio sp.]MBX3453427.1 ABC transporter ATP-binding protein [Ferrovibrio sp.]
MSETPAILLQGLEKTYGEGPRAKRALKGINLEVPRGCFFGLLGPNGAGKSTLINILAGLTRKSAGSAAIWGFDIERQTRQARAAIGVVPQELNLDPFFTPRQAMDFQAGLYGVPAAERRTDEILAAMGLTDKANAYARTLSGGMRRRLLVAKALVHAPPVLVLDEPTAGVDIELRQQLWAYVKGLNAAGTTVVLTTHYLEEAEALCDRIAIINHGEVAACDSTPALLARLDRKDVILTLARPLGAVPAALIDGAGEGLGAELLGPQRLRLHYRPSQMPFAQVLARIQAAGLEISDLTTQEADLEDLFLDLTRKVA